MKERWYLCSENKGADQLCCYCTADLHLFSHWQKSGFLMTQLKYKHRLLLIFFYLMAVSSLRVLCEVCVLCFVIVEPPRGKTNNVVSEQVRHKPACTSTEKSEKLEISDLSRRGIVLSE